jgi:hypothetical protein
VSRLSTLFRGRDKFRFTKRNAVAAWGTEYDPVLDSLVDITGNRHDARLGSVGGVPAGALVRGVAGSKYLDLNGVAGNYAGSTATTLSANTSIVDVEVEVVTPSAFVSGTKALWFSDGFTFDFMVNNAGLRVLVNNVVSIVTTANLSIVPGVPTRLRFVADPAAGTVTFYEAARNQAWQQVGDVVTVAAWTWNSTNIKRELGTAALGTTRLWACQIHHASLYQGNRDSGGTLLSDFDPNRDTSPYGLGPLTASTGEVWTVNRSAAAALSAGIVGPSGQKYLRIRGTSNGHNFAATPAAVGSPLDITGDIAIAVHVDRLLPAEDRSLVIRRQEGVDGNLIAYQLGQWLFGPGNATPALKFVWNTVDGTTLSHFGSVPVPASYTHVGVTHVVNNGSDQHVSRFYGSVDGENWTLLETITSGGTTTRRSNAAHVAVGGTNVGVYGAHGDYYRVRIWNAASFDGTPVADFDPNKDTSGYGVGPVTSTTGEVWTVNRTASDTNDPLVLPFAGEKYLSLPGLAGNVTTSAGLEALAYSGVVEWRWDGSIAPDPSGTSYLFDRWDTTTGAGRMWRVMLAAGTGVVSLGLAATADAFRATVVLSALGSRRVQARLVLQPDVGGNTDISLYSKTSGALVDDTGWAQVGSTQTIAGAQAFNAVPNGRVTIGGQSNVGGAHPSGRLHRFLHYHAGVVVADFDPSRSVEPHTTFTASTGETWTINRSASGRKAVLVDRPLLLFGTDDYLEVPDHADLRYVPGSDFSVAFVYRDALPNSAGVRVMLGKGGQGAANPGWLLYAPAGVAVSRIQFHDGGGGATVGESSVAVPGGTSVLVAGVVAGGFASSFVNSVDSPPPTDVSTLASGVTSTAAMRAGRASGADTLYHDMELIGAAIFRRALTPAELARVAREFGAS